MAFSVNTLNRKQENLPEIKNWPWTIQNSHSSGMTSFMPWIYLSLMLWGLPSQHLPSNLAMHWIPLTPEQHRSVTCATGVPLLSYHWPPLLPPPHHPNLSDWNYVPPNCPTQNLEATPDSLFSSPSFLGLKSKFLGMTLKGLHGLA